MEHGFETIKDVLDVIIIPIAIFAIGALLPRLFESAKTHKFRALIKRELGEMEPKPDQPKEGGKWCQHLGKRFIHEEIFENISENRDFILSLPPDFAYNTTQLWIHFHKATASQTRDDLAEHGAAWCDYLRGMCSYLDGKRSKKYLEKVYKPWERIIQGYHPELIKSGRLTGK